MPNGQGQTPGPQARSPQGGAAQGGTNQGFNLDEKTKNTMIWTAVFYAASRAAEEIIGWIGFRFFAGGVVGRLVQYTGFTFPVGNIIRSVIWALIIGAILGFVISKFWPAFQRFNQKTLKLTSVFKFFFVWDVIAAVVFGVLISFSAFFTGALPVLFTVIGIVVGAFVFAKGFETKLGHLYRM